MVEKFINADAALFARDLVLGYRRGAPVAGPLDLEVSAGELILLSGSNGSGKTTLLRTVAGLQKPLGGSLTARDAVLLPTRIPKIKGFTVSDFIRTAGGYTTPDDIGHNYPEEGVVYPDKTVKRNKKVGYTIPDDIGHIFSEEGVVYPTNILERLGIADLTGRDISTLSDGQFQKVCLCPAIAAGKKLILLDEPTAFLDAETRRQLLRLLQDLATGKLTGRRVAVIISSHDLAVCRDYCTREISLDKK